MTFGGVLLATGVNKTQQNAGFLVAYIMDSRHINTYSSVDMGTHMGTQQQIKSAYK